MTIDTRRLHDLLHLNLRNDEASAQLNDLMERQAGGEQVDAAQFTALLAQRSTTKAAFNAQADLHKSPLKVVMNEMGR